VFKSTPSGGAITYPPDIIKAILAVAPKNAAHMATSIFLSMGFIESNF
jgi:hypothetical protein